MTIGLYGPMVIGAEQAAREAVVVQKQSHIYGPMVGAPPAKAERKAKPPAADTAAEPETPAEDEAATGAGKYLSTRELDAAVKANPALVDGLLEQELARVPEPRPTALKSLLAAETSEQGGKRPEVVEMINAALGAGK